MGGWAYPNPQAARWIARPSDRGPPGARAQARQQQYVADQDQLRGRQVLRSLRQRSLVFEDLTNFGGDHEQTATPDILADDAPGHVGCVADLEARQVDEDPSLTCLPPGVPRIGSPDKIMRNENEVVFLHDDLNGAFWRIVPLNGASHRDIQPTCLGDSIGWWEDDTLVVETVGSPRQRPLTSDRHQGACRRSLLSSGNSCCRCATRPPGLRSIQGIIHGIGENDVERRGSCD